MNEQRPLTRPDTALVLSVFLVMAGCAGKAPAPVVDRAGPAGVPQAAVTAAPVAGKDAYTVKKGDTLYSIALDHGLDYKDLVVWNSIDNPNRILVGQQLRVRAPGSAVGSEVVVVRPIAAASALEPRTLGASADSLKREPKAGKEPYSEQALARARAPEPVVPRVVEPVAITAKAETRPEARSENRNDAKAGTRVEAQGDAKAGEAAAGSEEIGWVWPASGKLIGTFSEGGNKGIDITGKAGDAVLAAGSGKVVYSGTGIRGYGKLLVVKHNDIFVTVYAHNQNVLVKEGQTVGKGQKIAEMGSSDADQTKLHFEVRRQGKATDPLKLLPQR